MPAASLSALMITQRNHLQGHTASEIKEVQTGLRFEAQECQSQGNPVPEGKFSRIRHTFSLRDRTIRTQQQKTPAVAGETGAQLFLRPSTGVTSFMPSIAPSHLLPWSLLWHRSLLTPFFCLCSVSPGCLSELAVQKSDLWELRAQITCTPSRSLSPLFFSLVPVSRLIEREALRPGNEANGNICLSSAALWLCFYQDPALLCLSRPMWTSQERYKGPQPTQCQTKEESQLKGSRFRK